MRQKLTRGKTHVEHGEGIVSLVEGFFIFGQDIIRMETESVLGRVEQGKGEAEVNDLRWY